jgi:hypothetical protein
VCFCRVCFCCSQCGYFQQVCSFHTKWRPDASWRDVASCLWLAVICCTGMAVLANGLCADVESC